MTTVWLLQMAFLGTPLSCWAVSIPLGRRFAARAAFLVLAWIVGYVLLMASVHVYDGVLEAAKDDPTLSDAERAEAREAWTSDVGRNFAPCTGIPISLIWSTVNFAVLWTVEAIARLALAGLRRWLKLHAKRGSPDVEGRWTGSPETGNPYQSPATERPPTSNP